MTKGSTDVRLGLQGVSYAGMVLILAGEVVRKTAMVGQSVHASHVPLALQKLYMESSAAMPPLWSGCRSISTAGLSSCLYQQAVASQLLCNSPEQQLFDDISIAGDSKA